MEDAGITEVQLSIIREVVDILGTAGLSFWLWGGWAVDFLTGDIGRPHRDIEFVVFERDRERLKTLLAQHTFELVDDRPEDVISRKQGQLVEFYFVKKNSVGQLVTPGRWEFWPWPAEAFDGTTGRLRDIVCPVVSAQAQLAMKEEYQSQTGDSPRPKDVEDMRRLREFLAGRTGT